MSSSIPTELRKLVPRRHRWKEHFSLHQARIEGITLIGQATVRLLQLNASQRLLARQLLAAQERYP
jgi:hypothetical protein